MNQNKLVGVIWFPHAGGRWLCRSLLGNHLNVFQMAFAHPWNFYSDNTVLGLDKTSQVHKARSLPELKYHIDILKSSIHNGRVQGLKEYYSYFKNLHTPEKENIIVGELCMGAPVPESVELNSIYEACPDMKIIHLVRHPASSFPSFKSRYELDGDPVKVAGYWATFNAHVKQFFKDNKEFQNQYLEIRYEDLISKQEHTLRNICNFLEIDFDERIIENDKKVWGKGSKDEIDQNTKDIIYRVAKSEIEEFYE